MTEMDLFDKKYCMVIAEIAQSHDGDIAVAEQYIDAAADAGVDAVKFQTHIAAEESTPHEPWRVKFSTQDKTRFDYWRRMEFTADEWLSLRTRTQAHAMKFISSPFSDKSVALLHSIGADALKVASGEVNNPYLIRAIAATGLPVLVSSGMSYMAELDSVVDVLRDAGIDFALMQCTSMYPTPSEKVGVEQVDVFRQRYKCYTGLSDHSGTIYPSLLAAYMGAAAVEIHVTVSRDQPGPDVSSSLTFDETRQLVAGIRFVEELRANPIDKDGMADELNQMRSLFTKSVVAKVPIIAGTTITEDMLTVKKPGFGIPAAALPTLIGRVVEHDLDADELLTEDNLV